MLDYHLTLDDFDLDEFLNEAGRFRANDFGYVVTPNVDHIVRLHECDRFREVYAQARYTLLDSRLAHFVFRAVRGENYKVCHGSDLTAALFERVIARDDRIAILGGRPEQIDQLKRQFGLHNVVHYNPPMGFWDRPEEVERCLRFVEEASPFRFCIMAVGTPRQEYLALQLKQRARARGLVLCTGASIDFLTGAQKRAPAWMRRAGVEWLFRLLDQPRRLAHRYLVRGPRFFAYLLVDTVQRRPRPASLQGS